MTHMCARMSTRGEREAGALGIFSGMTVQLLPYDAIKQNTPCHPAPDYAVPPLRVNDVTIMSPSRIITIAADTDLYNAKRSGNPGSEPGRATRNRLLPRDSPNCTSFLVARHFPNSDSRKREGRKQAAFHRKSRICCVSLK